MTKLKKRCCYCGGCVKIQNILLTDFSPSITPRNSSLVFIGFIWFKGYFLWKLGLDFIVVCFVWGQNGNPTLDTCLLCLHTARHSSASSQQRSCGWIGSCVNQFDLLWSKTSFLCQIRILAVYTYNQGVLENYYFLIQLHVRTGPGYMYMK